MSKPAFCNAIEKSRAFDLIRNDFSAGLGHAYMVVSPDDETVDTFFTLVAATLFCKNGNACFECAECKKVLHDNHADVFHVNRKRDKIKVEDISQMLSGISVKSLSGKKIYFVHRADLMNVQAQNKLLKTFEEPPQDVTVFLGVANEAAMLDTVKSRSRTVYIDLFDEQTVYDELRALGCDEELCAVASACCEGQLGKAYKIANSPEYTELYNTALALLKRLNRSSDVVKVDSDVIAQKNMNGFLDVLSIILRDMLVVKQNEDLMLSKHISKEIIALSSGYSSHALAQILMLINDVRRKLSLNVNATATLDSLLFSILEVRHKWQR